MCAVRTDILGATATRYGADIRPANFFFRERKTTESLTQGIKHPILVRLFPYSKLILGVSDWADLPGDRQFGNYCTHLQSTRLSWPGDREGGNYLAHFWTQEIIEREEYVLNWRTKIYPKIFGYRRKKRIRYSEVFSVAKHRSSGDRPTKTPLMTLYLWVKSTYQISTP